MHGARYERIRNNPSFKQLVAERSQLSWTLAALILVAYYGFVLLVAFGQSFLSAPLSDGGVTTVGIPVALGVIVFAIILTGIYVTRANSHFDALTATLIKETK